MRRISSRNYGDRTGTLRVRHTHPPRHRTTRRDKRRQCKGRRNRRRKGSYVKVPVPMRQVLVEIVRVSAIMMIELLKLTVQLTTTGPKTQPMLKSGQITLLKLPVLLVTTRQVTKEEKPSVIQLPNSGSIIVDDKTIVNVKFKDTVGMQIMI